MQCIILLQLAKESNLKCTEGEKKYFALKFTVSVVWVNQNHPNLRPQRKLKMI